jgi:hypothetical protein
MCFSPFWFGAAGSEVVPIAVAAPAGLNRSIFCFVIQGFSFAAWAFWCPVSAAAGQLQSLAWSASVSVPRASAPVGFSFLASCCDSAAPHAPVSYSSVGLRVKVGFLPPKTFPSRSVLPRLGFAASSSTGFPSRLVFVFWREACYLIFLSPPRFRLLVDLVLPLFCGESGFGLGLCSCVLGSCADKVFLPSSVLIFAGSGPPPLDVWVRSSIRISWCWFWISGCSPDLESILPWASQSGSALRLPGSDLVFPL